MQKRLVVLFTASAAVLTVSLVVAAQFAAERTCQSLFGPAARTESEFLSAGPDAAAPFLEAHVSGYSLTISLPSE